jgi:hypothetical protein
VIVLSSHAGDGTAEATWSQCEVDVESCRRRCCQVMMVTALPKQLGRGAM